MDEDFVVQSNAQDVVNNNARLSAYSTGPIPAHEHNGSDSNFIPLSSTRGYFPQSTSAPTKNSSMFGNSMASSTSANVLYYYDFTNKAWKAVYSSINVIQTYAPGAAGTATLDLSKGNYHRITMPAGNITIAISNGTAGQPFIIDIIQDSSGSRTITWFTTIKWSGGTAPILTTTANKIDSVGFLITSVGNYQGYIVGQNI